jgi:hypothetical protein
MLLVIFVAMAVVASLVFVLQRDPTFTSSSSWEQLGRPAAGRTTVRPGPPVLRLK